MEFGDDDYLTSEFLYTFEDDGDGGMPIITLEVMSDCSNNEPACPDPPTVVIQPVQNTGVHFLTDKATKPEEEINEGPRRNEMLEYVLRTDGSVICKLCGEVLPSRTHWYRHKYKFHVIQPLNPAPLFQCEQCLVYFKSRKGYIGHLASRHSELLADSSPVLSNAQIESIPIKTEELKEEPDPEMGIPTSSIHQKSTKTAPKTSETKKTYKNCNLDPNIVIEDWEEKRLREEKLVADIIEKVKRECEAQGGGGAARRGYTRRTTVMHS